MSASCPQTVAFIRRRSEPLREGSERGRSSASASERRSRAISAWSAVGRRTVAAGSLPSSRPPSRTRPTPRSATSTGPHDAGTRHPYPCRRPPRKPAGGQTSGPRVNVRRRLGPPARVTRSSRHRGRCSSDSKEKNWLSVNRSLISPCIRRTRYEPLVSTHPDTQGPGHVHLSFAGPKRSSRRHPRPFPLPAGTLPSSCPLRGFETGGGRIVMTRSRQRWPSEETASYRSRGKWRRRILLRPVDSPG